MSRTLLFPSTGRMCSLRSRSSSVTVPDFLVRAGILGKIARREGSQILRLPCLVALGGGVFPVCDDPEQSLRFVPGLLRLPRALPVSANRQNALAPLDSRLDEINPISHPMAHTKATKLGIPEDITRRHGRDRLHGYSLPRHFIPLRSVGVVRPRDTSGIPTGYHVRCCRATTGCGKTAVFRAFGGIWRPVPPSNVRLIDQSESLR